MTVGNRERGEVKITPVWLTAAAMIVCLLISGKTSAQKDSKPGIEKPINVRLEGVTDYDLAKVFEKAIDISPGVIEVKRFGFRIVPEKPRECFVNWRVAVKDNDPFRLQANIMKIIRDIPNAGGEVFSRGVPCRITAAEFDLLKGIRPGDSTSGEVRFVVGP